MSVESSVRADCWALQKLSQYAEGKVLIWAWVSRGLVELEWVAKIHFGGDVQKCKDALAATPGKLAELCQFDELPVVDWAEDTVAAQTDAQNDDHQLFSFWAICDDSNGSDSESKPILLPMWMRSTIDLALLKWKEQAHRWQERISKRHLDGKAELPPKQLKSYREFMESNTRSLVFDKTRKAQVTNVSAKPLHKLKKHCILLILHLNEDAEKLAVTTGCGKLWRLKLLECGKSVDDNLPSEVDHFEGLYHYCTVFKNACDHCIEMLYYCFYL
jgi:hypothetical protein